MSFRNLEVPYFSQRENKCIWYERYSKDNKLVQMKPELEGSIVPNGKTYFRYWWKASCGNLYANIKLSAVENKENFENILDAEIKKRREG